MSICRHVANYMLLTGGIQLQMYSGPRHQLGQQGMSVGFAQKPLEPESLHNRVQDRPDLNGKAPAVDRVIKKTEADHFGVA